mmetsp:Transcript_9558/g.18594  ORF Transcript_9558/g.18594 Transcript_9558/m.18594 type:complete len:208 (-) Transcript_9558:682-1305(-)
MLTSIPPRTARLFHAYGIQRTQTERCGNSLLPTLNGRARAPTDALANFDVFHRYHVDDGRIAKEKEPKDFLHASISTSLLSLLFERSRRDHQIRSEHRGRERGRHTEEERGGKGKSRSGHPPIPNVRPSFFLVFLCFMHKHRMFTAHVCKTADTQKAKNKRALMIDSSKEGVTNSFLGPLKELKESKKVSSPLSPRKGGQAFQALPC